MVECDASPSLLFQSFSTTLCLIRKVQAFKSFDRVRYALKGPAMCVNIKSAWHFANPHFY